MISSCLQGQTGPHKELPRLRRPGIGPGGFLQHADGLARPRADRGPYGTITDSLAPRFRATALAAGLLYRRRTGRGVHLDVAQVEAAVYSLSPWIADFDVNGHSGYPPGQLNGSASSPHGAFRWTRATTAGWPWPAGTTPIGPALTDAVMGTSTTATRHPPGHASGAPSRAAIDEVEALVESVDARSKDAAAVADALRGGGVEAVPVADLGDASADPQLAHRGHYVALHHPCMGECRYERIGFRLSDAPAGYERTSPLLGEHNEMVLGEILGLDGAERARLLADGVL